MNDLRCLAIDDALPYLCRDASLWDRVPEPKRPAPSEIADFQKRGGRCFASVALRLSVRVGEEELVLTGTADGVEIGEDGYRLDEFLPRERDRGGIRREYALCRAKLLGLALCRAKNLQGLTLRLVSFCEGEWSYQSFPFTAAELTDYFTERAERLSDIAGWFAERRGAVRFPYDSLRAGQKDLMKSVFASIRAGQRLYACAPTGVGKTLSVLYPAMKALEKGIVKQIFYLSPKNTLKKQAFETALSLQETPVFRVLSLSAKLAVCPRGGEECEMTTCALANGFYTRLPEALARLLRHRGIDADLIRAVARETAVCPFELALAAMPFCDVVICDYNHVFAPGISVAPSGKDRVILIDEAHNLPPRLRENHSAALTPRDFDALFADESAPARALSAECAPLMARFAADRKDFQDDKTPFRFAAPELLLKEAEKLLPAVNTALRDGFGPLGEDTRRILADLQKAIKRFLYAGKEFDSDFAFLPDEEGGGKIALLHPRRKIDERLASWKSAVFFSATLLPKDYYFETLAGRDGDPFLILPSPFPRENLFVGICDVDVTYRQRFQTAPKLCGIIRSATLSRPGNYIVFLPSLEYASFLSADYKKRFVDQKIVVQERVMTPEKRRRFLEEFAKSRNSTMVAFCVTGGIFGEGIDLPGDALSGVILVGTGFPPPNAEAEAESASYYEKGLDGKSFAYTLPGFNRVLQAAGRVIRSETDRGFLILADARFCGEDIKELFPAAWDDARLLSSDGEIRRELARFW